MNLQEKIEEYVAKIEKQEYSFISHSIIAMQIIEEVFWSKKFEEMACEYCRESGWKESK